MAEAVVREPEHDQVIDEIDSTAVEVPVAKTPEMKVSGAKPANGPLVRTMVEAIPDLTDNESGLSDILLDDLHDVFTATSYGSPRTKALLKSREAVDIHELYKELQQYAESIGVSPRER